MGIETAAIIMGGIAVASEVGKMGSSVSAANAEESALNLQSKEQTLQYQQKQTSNYDVMQKVLQAQEARMTVSGASFSSPSFQAIQQQTLRVGAKEGKNLEIEEDLFQQNIANEKRNVNSKLYASLFGDIAGLGLEGFDIGYKWPKSGS